MAGLNLGGNAQLSNTLQALGQLSLKKLARCCCRIVILNGLRGNFGNSTFPNRHVIVNCYACFSVFRTGWFAYDIAALYNEVFTPHL